MAELPGTECESVLFKDSSTCLCLFMIVKMLVVAHRVEIKRQMKGTGKLVISCIRSCGG